MSTASGSADRGDRGSGPGPVSPAPAGSVGPLDTYLMPRSLLEPADPVVVRAREDEVERRVATCMAERGFTYVPILGRSPQSPPSGTIEPEPDTRAWAQRWGYGIATAPPTGGTGDEVGGSDPDAAVVQELDVATRRDYERALYGRALDDGAPDPDVEMPSADGDLAADRAAAAAALDVSCRTLAIRAVYGGTSPRAFRWPDGMDPWADRARLHDAALGDPRVVRALADWSRRMTESGHPGFADLDGPAASVVERRDRIMAGAGDETASVADELARLARDEVALAVADWDARAASQVVATMVGVRWEREREYVAEHRTALTAHRDAINATG
ncbi:hypothetical protein FDO65_14590 [Nakamurella flava]|uniref:Uncharacterized protein n=1 Tax=Nakamurella flava TaxID=2576308 RepID=A0A4U6QF27_9ACTN|nr:hypothetical protein [Nakamurella flava]TKV58740.1 hypothetical protein FDO65_14590 [Nakamurella flava]